MDLAAVQNKVLQRSPYGSKTRRWAAGDVCLHCTSKVDSFLLSLVVACLRPFHVSLGLGRVLLGKIPDLSQLVEAPPCWSPCQVVDLPFLKTAQAIAGLRPEDDILQPMERNLVLRPNHVLSDRLLWPPWLQPTLPWHGWSLPWCGARTTFSSEEPSSGLCPSGFDRFFRGGPREVSERSVGPSFHAAFRCLLLQPSAPTALVRLPVKKAPNHVPTVFCSRNSELIVVLNNLGPFRMWFKRHQCQAWHLHGDSFTCT